MHNNTIITSPASKNNYPSFSVIQLTEYGSVMSNIRAYNNAIITDGVKLLDIPTSFIAQKPHFKGNGYWANGKAFSLRFGKDISSLESLEHNVKIVRNSTIKMLAYLRTLRYQDLAK